MLSALSEAISQKNILITYFFFPCKSCFQTPMVASFPTALPPSALSLQSRSITTTKFQLWWMQSKFFLLALQCNGLVYLRNIALNFLRNWRHQLLLDFINLDPYSASTVVKLNSYLGSSLFNKVLLHNWKIQSQVLCSSSYPSPEARLQMVLVWFLTWLSFLGLHLQEKS